MQQVLIDFIKLGIMTPKALEHTYKKAKEKGLTTVMAYICEAQKNFGDKKSSFSLLNFSIFLYFQLKQSLKALFFY